MAAREPLATYTPRWYSGLLSKWLVVPIGVAFFVIGYLSSAVTELSAGVIWLLLLGSVLGFSLARSQLSTVALYDDRLVTEGTILPGGVETATVPYEEIAFVVRTIARGELLPHDSFYVVHADGVLVLPRLPADTDVVEILDGYVPDHEHRARGTPRDTARWLVYSDLAGDEEDLFVSKNRVKEVFGFEGNYTLQPTYFGDVDGVHSPEDVSPGELCTTPQSSSPG